MPKRKRRATATPGRLAWGGPARASDLRLSWLLVALLLLAVALGGGWWWLASADDRAFRVLAAEGADALARVEQHPDLGGRHLALGQPYDYRTRFPTSGPHDPGWTEPGFYLSAQPATRLVHALEHGNVVIYYDRPGEDALATLRAWAALYDGMWDGLVVTPSRGLGEAVVLTAWTRSLRLERFDAPAAAAFVDAYRGRGPENPVR